MTETPKANTSAVSDPTRARAEWMGILARAPESQLEAAWDDLSVGHGDVSYSLLRAPEKGLVMVRGRAGGDGQAFNLGEMTVTRGSLRLEDGLVGHAYVPGRNRDHARIAAICDALMQGACAGEVQRTVIEPLHSAYMARRAQTAGQAEKTRVDFFTMVRGEN